MKYNVKNTFYLYGILVLPGEVVELTEEEVEYFSPKDVLGKPVVVNDDGSTGDDNTMDPKDPNDDNTDDELKHLGGGYYELPNGEKIRGKEAAAEALQAMKAGEPDAQAQTDGAAAGGTGDAGHDKAAAEDRA